MKTFVFNLFKFLVFTSIFFTFSCVEEYWPELKNIDEKILIVEGNISNLPGPYTVKLSKSLIIDSLPDSHSSRVDFDPVENAVVEIVDDQSNSEFLTEVEPGIYKSSDGGIQGIVGHNYKLIITTSSGDVFESEYEELLAPVGISSISAEEMTNEADKRGYQFSLSSETLPDESCYFIWEAEETYEYHSPYIPTHYFDGGFANEYIGEMGLYSPGNMTYTYPYNLKNLDYNIDSMLYCWKTDIIKENYIINTEHFDISNIENFKINFVQFGDLKLRIKYSLLVRQYRITRNAHHFIDQLIEQNSNSVTDLYTKQPYQLRGNMSCISNPDLKVIGLFYTRGISQKRIFAPADKEPLSVSKHSMTYCQNIPSTYYERNIVIDDILNYIEKDMHKRPSSWPIYFGDAYIYTPLYNDPDKFDYFFAAYSKSCVDCRYRGGLNSKPDYWED